MQAEYLNRRKKHMEQVAASSTGISGIRKRGIYMRNMTFGGFLAGLCTIIGLLCFIGAVSDAAEPKCIVTGCSYKFLPVGEFGQQFVLVLRKVIGKQLIRIIQL